MLFLTNLNISAIGVETFSPTTINGFFCSAKHNSPKIGTEVTRSKSSLSLKIGKINLLKKINSAGIKNPINKTIPYIVIDLGDIGPCPNGLSIKRAVGVANVFCNAISSLYWHGGL